MRCCSIRLLYACAAGTFLLTCSYLYLLQDLGYTEENAIRVGPGLGLQRIVAYAEDFLLKVRTHDCPGLIDVPFNVTIQNLVWQQVPERNIHIFSAHYDVRLGPKRHFVRIIGSSLGKVDPNTKVFCQIRFKPNLPLLVVEADTTLIWSKIWDQDSSQLYYWPYLFSCPIPIMMSDRVPYGVSLVSKPCSSAQNLLELAPVPTTTKKDFAICVKGLDFREDFSHRLVEWIEFQLIMGADVINFYVYSVHPNILNVLEHFQKLAKVRVYELTLPGGQPNDHRARTRYIKRNTWQKRRNELVPYNDCFYRHISTHNFVVLLDLDEAIVPLRHNTWQELLCYAVAIQPNALSKFASIAVQNVYFFNQFQTSEDPGIPVGAHMLRHVTRSANFSRPGFAVKSFLLTNQTLTAFNHYALAPLRSQVQRSVLLSRTMAQLHHYRARCPPNMDVECAKNFLRYRVQDTSVWKWKDTLLERMKNTLKILNLQ